MIFLETANDRLGFDPQSGALLSFRRQKASQQEFIAFNADDPVFQFQYLDAKRRFRQVTSRQAEEVSLSVQGAETNQDGQSILTMTFLRLAGFDIDVTVTVRAAKHDPCTHWSLTMRNQAGLLITDLQFPFIVVRYELDGTPGSESLLWPFGSGVLIKEPKPHNLRPDAPHTWQMRPENGGYSQYPGVTVAQFLAYFNDQAGIYVACLDTAGWVKQIRPVHRKQGCRLGISHVGDRPQHGERTIDYDIVLRSFHGDWYAAADLYREWSLQQPWAQEPLHKRNDLPEWLLDSPPHIVVRIQGELDLGPAEPNEAFLPYTKILPLVDEIAQRLEAPIVPVIMSWEREGPWIYPNCFPPAGGEESLRDFTAKARQRGWRVGTFCNGTRWVIGHFWSGYDGEDDFVDQGGERSVCRTHDGELWRESWDTAWRPSYLGCVGSSITREIAVDFVRQIIDYGLDWIQFFDQNIGVCTFPCYATDHEHPPLPGRWMTEKMVQVLDSFDELVREASHQSGGEREFIFSVETPANEYYLRRFQLCDVRVMPPGHQIGTQLEGFVPLYHYLYHEFIVMQGGFGTGPEPYHLPIKNAYNWVIGEIPGAVLQGDGQLMNRDSPDINWAAWDRPVGSNDDALQMLKTTTALRRGAAKPFLVFGRMLAPAQVGPIRIMRWQEAKNDHQIPAVFHSVWMAADGQLGWTLSNWTNEPQVVTIADARLGKQVIEHLSSHQISSQSHQVIDQRITLELPPLSCLLLASENQ